MQVSDFKAEPNPRGGQIDLSWTTPAEAGFKGVKVLRREFTLPLLTDINTDKQILDDSTTPRGQVGRFSDRHLKGETVYYYAIVAYDNLANLSPPVFASAMATTAYQTAAELYDDLPELYRRYDTLLPPATAALDAADKDKGQLRRLIEMFGLQFDLLRSFAGGMRDASSVERIDGELLPLLAKWIGWQSDYTLPLDKQRNEIKYAPYFYKTTGIAANLRATLNRLTTWDAQVKEFVHNVFLSNAAEQLTIYERERRGNRWQPAKLVSLDVAYEGRPAVSRARDGRSWLFYHARQAVPLAHEPGKPAPTEDRWHLWYKIKDQEEWLPSRRLTFGGGVNKYPAAVEITPGHFRVFWGSDEKAGSSAFQQLRLQAFAAGRPAHPPRLHGSKTGPFAFADGDQLIITIDDGVTSITRTVTFHQEHFQNLAAAAAAEVAARLDGELPGVAVTVADDGTITITAAAAGSASTLAVGASSVATALGLSGTAAGSDAASAALTGTAQEPFALKDGDSLVITVDGGATQLITFSQGGAASFNLSAAEVAAAINDILPGVASAVSQRVRLTSPTAGEAASVAVQVLSPAIREAGLSAFDVVRSTAAPALGFGTPLPPELPQADDTEPAAFKDNAGNLWLFWSSRRNGDWKIWYNRFDGTSWGASRQLTAGSLADREPVVVFDPADQDPAKGKIWVFWSRKKSNGLWNIFYRTTANVNFNTLAEADWLEQELTPVLADHDKKEPAPLFLGTDDIELFFSSNQADGWQVWSNRLTPNPAANDTRITTGQFTQRAPAALLTKNNDPLLLYRSNESRTYVSPLYPAAKTIDARYAGSTTVDTRNAAKIGLRDAIEDVQRYTYDTRKLDDAWYARDTVGVYLIPDTVDQQLIIRKQNMIASVLRNFLPIQLRVVLIIRQVFPESVYTYSQPEAKPQGLISEQMVDTILGEVLGNIDDAFRDRVNFRWVRTWDAQHPNPGLPDLGVLPPDFPFRLFLRGVEEGE
ncbi:MAG TPA: hypothetical protein VJ464_12060 [Blastocatellia bacterium]|nr:hypothetical protein [Blastocatellia bacterium]